MPAATAGLTRGDDRGLAHAIAAAVLRWLHDLDELIDSATKKPLPHDAKARFVLRIALAQALVLDTPGHAAITTVLPLVDGGPRKLVHGVFGTLMRQGARLPALPTLPDGVADRWRTAWGDEAVEAARLSLAAPPLLDVTLADPETTADWAEKLAGVSLLPGHVRLPAGARVAELPGYAEGAWWVQDIAASLPARTLGRGTGRSVLDLCAAPGGKTMQLAAAGWNVTAVDASKSRMARLKENLARTGLAAQTLVADALFYTADRQFEAVLVDAPCSATGIFRRHPDVLHRVRQKAIISLAEQQQAILSRAAQAVKPGGILVYAVCSLEPEEGESVANNFLSTHKSFEPCSPGEIDSQCPGLIRCKANGNIGEDHMLRVAPGALATAGGADGFFVATFHRKDERRPAPG